MMRSWHRLARATLEGSNAHMFRTSRIKNHDDAERQTNKSGVQVVLKADRQVPPRWTERYEVLSSQLKMRVVLLIGS